VCIRTFFDTGCSRHRYLATAEEQTQLVISFNTLISWRRVPLTRTFIFARAIEDPQKRSQGQLPANFGHAIGRKIAVPMTGFQGGRHWPMSTQTRPLLNTSH
jgi:hypothetical protein